MNNGRRRFLQGSLLGAAGVAGARLTARAQEPRAAKKPLSVLVLGGTGFIGPHMVREALRRGHEVSLFNRGRSNDELFPDLKTYIGDRDGKLDALEGQAWDAVIDNSGYVPRHVAESARLLADAAGHYLFISSISVYASFASPNDENSPLATMPDESVEEVTGDTYGPMKALAEQRAREEFGEERVTVLRPTYICGPGDHTDRYTYWPVRSARGGEMLWPGKPSDPIQIIDVRDLANFTIDCLEQRIAGTYNTVTPAGEFTMGELLEDCRAVAAANVEPVWVGAEFLGEQGALEGRELPIWSPPNGEFGGAALTSGERAHERGLVNRPTRETARDTLRWWQTLPDERRGSLRAGLGADREAELIAKWRNR